MSNTRDCDSTRAAIGSARPDGFSLSRYSIFVAFRRVSVIVLIYLACRAATCRWKKTSPSREYGRGPSGRGRGGVGRGAGGGEEEDGSLGREPRTRSSPTARPLPFGLQLAFFCAAVKRHAFRRLCDEFVSIATQ